MSQLSDAQPAKRRYGLMVLIAAFLLANLLIFGRLGRFWYLSEPNRQITIGPETTYLEGPLTDNGYVDYIAALNQRQSEGVTPENNAVALLVQAYGPEVIGEGSRGRYFAMLGVPPPAGGAFLVNESAFVHRQAGGSDAAVAQQKFAEARDIASERPWTRDEFPDVAAMLDANAAPLALITEASLRQRYYSPLLSADTPSSMFMVLLPIEQEQREAARQLTARAMLKLGEGDGIGAWEDLLACHRLARLTGQSPFMISAMVSIAIDSIAFEADRALIASPVLTADQSRKCLDDLQSLPPLPSIADALDQTERLGLLDAATLVARGQAETLIDASSPQNLQPAMTGAIEWDKAFEVINDQIDGFVDALRERDAATRSRKLAEQVQVVKSHDPNVRSLGIRSYLGSRDEASRDMGWALVHFFLPACEQAAMAETRGRARERLLLAGFALTTYQREQGAYPDSLAALVPDLLSDVPVDPWSGNELIYRRTDDGFVIYSVDENLKDDGGVPTDPQGGRAQGDIVLQVGNE